MSLGECINEIAPWLISGGGLLGVVLGVSTRYLQKHKR